MVATAYPDASDAAREILEAGGNAVDAAVAAAWALCVCEPSGSGLGGQTTLLLHRPDASPVVIDGHSHAPARASLKRISPDQQRNGYRACTVPATPATLAHAQASYGVLPPQRVLEPAIRLAEDGFAISRLLSRQLVSCFASLRATGSHRAFMKGKRPLRRGETLRQPALATTLRRLAEAGCEDFYHGDLARAIARDMRAHEGLVSRKDLAECALPVEREPVAIDYRGHRVLGVPPPGGGVPFLQALKVIERLAPRDFGASTDAWYETIADVVFAVFAFRERWPIHASEFSPSIRHWLLGDELVGEMADEVRRTARHASMESGGEPPGDTTHLNVADARGNVVALTQSIQSLFGAKVAHRKLGFFYNNYLVTCPRHPHPSQLGSRCTPRSNVTPALVLSGDASPHGGTVPMLAIGAAGSRRILSATLQVLTSVLDRGLSLEAAMAAPRIHALLNGDVWVEESALSERLQRRLEARYRRVRVKSSPSYAMGAVQAIERRADGTVSAAADPRRDGTAVCLPATPTPDGPDGVTP
jgi:gamma-glutamyltranspeptidase/glutathione hydrolase